MVLKKKFSSSAVVGGVLIALVGVGLGGCSSQDGSSEDGESSCPAVIVYRDAEYTQTRAADDLTAASRVGTARLSSCADTDAEVSDAAGSIEIWGAEGVDPATAIIAKYGGGTFYYVANDVSDPCAVKFTYCE